MKKAGDTSRFSPGAQPAFLVPGVSLGGVIAGKYRVERVIGRGGMGVVVAASHLQLDRRVAIKLIRAELSEDTLIVERMLREARAVASIQSEHVARVLDMGTLESGSPFIVMEYLDGEDLDTLLQREGPLPELDAVDFLLQACEAIAEAHRNRIVHRDLKPANLFVARQPGGASCIKVVDFGISKLMNTATESLTQPSQLVGSLYHMAPEQLSGAAVDARTDVWALGVLLFEMLTGQKPFRDGVWPLVCAQVLNEPAPDLGVLGQRIPEDLRAAIRRCLSRSPDERFGNVAELAVAIMPFGSRRARHSLERIVRLATSTGSLSAETLSPATPNVGTRDERSLVQALSRKAPPPPEPAALPPEPAARGSSQAPVSSDPAPRQARRRDLWALGGALAAFALLLVVASRVGDRREPELRTDTLRQLPAAPPDPPSALLAPSMPTPGAPAPRTPAAGASPPAAAPLVPAEPAALAVPAPALERANEAPPSVAPVSGEPASVAPARPALPRDAVAVESTGAPRVAPILPLGVAQELQPPSEPAAAVPPEAGAAEAASAQPLPAPPRAVRRPAAAFADAGAAAPPRDPWKLNDVGYE